MKTSGIFTISLDFERIWGVHDSNPQGYDANIEGVDNAKKKEGIKHTDNYFTTYNGKEGNRNMYDLFSSATVE